MDLITGEVLFFGANANMCLLGWDKHPNRKAIKNAEMNQLLPAKTVKPQRQRKGLFNRG